MCSPVAFAATQFAVAAGSAGLQYVGQAQQAAAQQTVEMRRFAETERFRRQNADNAVAAFNLNAAQLANRRMEEDAARSDEIERVRTQTRLATGAALASGDAGGGLNMILTQLARQGGAAVNRVEAGERFRTVQYGNEMEAARARALDAINSARPYIPQPVIPPSPIQIALGVGQAGLQAGTSYYQLKYLQTNPGAYRVNA